MKKGTFEYYTLDLGVKGPGIATTPLYFAFTAEYDERTDKCELTSHVEVFDEDTNDWHRVPVVIANVVESTLHKDLFV